MPVLGHAFVGLAFGVSTQPILQAKENSTITAVQSAVWTPLIIILSYLPDLLAQLALVFGSVDARQITHALPIAIILSLAATPALTRIVGASAYRTFVVTFVSLALHDIMDVLQATDRMLWWPFSYHAVWHEEALIPTSPVRETICFGFPCVLFLIIRYRRRLIQIPAVNAQLVIPGYLPRCSLLHWWLNITVTVSLLGAAAITHNLRQVRDAQLEQARHEAQEFHQYTDALVLLDEAEQWPSTAKPGRIDYLRGWIYSQVGDRNRAEGCYLLSLHADPNYFWAVADFALFYASAPEGRDVRQQRVAPYVRRLREDFARHPQLSETLAAIIDALSNASVETSATLKSHDVPFANDK